jgi:hypothetical protein
MSYDYSSNPTNIVWTHYYLQQEQNVRIRGVISDSEDNITAETKPKPKLKVES